MSKKEDLYEDAENLLKIGQYTSALKKYEEGLSKYKDGRCAFKIGLICKKGALGESDKKKAVEFYKVGSNLGDSDSQVSLALCYLNGDVLEKDSVKGVELLKKAIKKNNSTAYVYLGICFLKGDGVIENKNEAVRLFSLAKDLGDFNAYYCLAECYKDGSGLKKDEDMALKYYIKAASNGIVGAQLRLSSIYILGECGLEINYDEGLRWLKMAVNANDNEALYQYAVCFANGYGVEKNMEEAFRWLKKSSEQGNIDAQFQMGLMCEFGVNTEPCYKDAEMWYTKAAESGNKDAMFCLGRLYLGKGDVEADQSKVIYWWTRGTENNEPESMCYLALRYANGFGVDKNPDKALELLTESANMGCGEAEYYLASFYAAGNLVEQNDGMAITLLERAAEHKNYDAQVIYAKACEADDGPFIKKNLDKARAIYNDIIECQKNSFLKYNDQLAYAYYNLALITNDPMLDELQNLEQRKELFLRAKDFGYICDSEIDYVDKQIAALTGAYIEKDVLDQLIEKIIENQISLDEYNDCVESLLYGLFKDNWDGLKSNVKKILRSGLKSFASLSAVDKKLGIVSDYSGALIYFCKAVEIVFYDIFGGRYIKYLKSNNVEPTDFNKNNTGRSMNFFPFLKKNKYVNENDHKFLEIGKFARMFGFIVPGNSTSNDDCENESSLALDTIGEYTPYQVMEKNMARYCNDTVFRENAFTDLTSQKKEISISKYMYDFVGIIDEKIRKLRNAAAHDGVISQDEARICIDTLLFKDSIFVKLVSMVKPEFLKDTD